jgi:ABC-type Fe3+-siderophore transport system, permease component
VLPLQTWRCAMRNNLLLFIALAFTLYSPFLGAIPLDFAAVFEPSSLEHKIFFEIRLPRLLFTFSAGVILALSGLVYQTLFRNPLMTPYTLGISSGAVLGAGIAIKLSLGTLVLGIGMVSIFGFFGAMATVFLLLYLSRFLHASHQHALLLLGIALSLFYTSALMVVFYLGDAMQNDMLIRFTMGSLSVIGWQHPLVLGIIAALFTIAVMLWRFELELMGISEQGALLRGVDTKRLTLLLLLVSSFGIGVLVSISGPIGFVGLIVPHIVTKLYPVSLKHRILKTALLGGLFLLFCDTLTRAVPTQSELPIGIITALFGAPFFIYLLITKAKG